MNDYIDTRIDARPCSETLTDLLAAMLAEEGYESFVPDQNGLNAYIKEADFSAQSTDNILAQLSQMAAYTVTHTKVEGRDWNEEWEKNYFQPIVIDDQCVIHSSFHTHIPRCKYDIVIDPKMAFGTGHHATTSLILRQLLQTPPTGKNVIDMGTGTGILAILATMLGAAKVTAIEIDEFAYTNAVENMRLNHTQSVSLIHGDATALSPLTGTNLFIANINRNIICQDLRHYAHTLAPRAEMLLSGFYEDEIPIITQKATGYGLEYAAHTTLNNWACLKLVKK